MVANDNISLEGTIEIDRSWFGGYAKPENIKIKQVGERLLQTRTTSAG